MTIGKQTGGAGGNGAGTGRAAGPAIGFRLEPGSGVPTYLQLVHQVEQALRVGYLAHGDQLPTVKDVVESLAINPNTVLKAYRELEHRGLAVGRPGQGTFIEGTLRHVGIAEQNALRKALAGWLAAADAAGLDEDGIVALYSSALRDFGERRGAATRPAGRRRGAGNTAGPAGRTGVVA
jgi:GntR family transcriptional regulator